MSLATRLLFEIEAEVGAPVEFGDPGGGARRMIAITGGAFRGAARGVVTPGADWQSVLPDGTIELSAHYGLLTDAGEAIEVTSVGVRAGPPAVLARLARGEPVDPSEYYFRTAIRFRTGAPGLRRLNTLLAVSTARRGPQRVELTVFEVL